MRPWWKTAMRSDIVSASDWSCVTYTTVTPSSSCRCLISSCICSRSCLSSAPSGSSMSTSFGPKTSARATATRCCCPPDSCAGLRSRKLRQPHHVERALDTRLDIRLGHAVHLEREGEILRDRHVREQRVVLEDHADAALVRRHVVDALAVERDRAGGRILEAGEHHERRRLAGAGRPEEREELAARKLEVESRRRRAFCRRTTC